MRTLSLLKAGILTALVFVFYYFIQFKRWHRKVTHVLAEVMYAGDDIRVLNKLPGIQGRWAIELYYFYRPNTTGYFIKYEVTADPNKFTNKLVLTYWLTELLHRSCKRPHEEGTITLFDYRIYKMDATTIDNVPVTLDDFFRNV